MNMKHTQFTESLRERASLYAAGAMTDSERQEYLRHLEEDECTVCRSEVNELQEAISLLALTAPLASPSPSVKERLMERARASVPVVEPKPQRGFWWLQWLTAPAAVASIVVALVVARSNSDLRQQADALRGRIAELEIQVSGRENQIAMLSSPAVRVVDLAGQGDNRQATARLFWDRQQKKWFISVRDLPPTSADKTYQLWFVPAIGNPVSAAVFNTAPDGSGKIEVSVPAQLAELKAAAVTVEPAGGLPQPSGNFALSGAL
jgi:anti-sigma-K factor RskA